MLRYTVVSRTVLRRHELVYDLVANTVTFAHPDDNDPDAEIYMQLPDESLSLGADDFSQFKQFGEILGAPCLANDLELLRLHRTLLIRFARHLKDEGQQ